MKTILRILPLALIFLVCSCNKGQKDRLLLGKGADEDVLSATHGSLVLMQGGVSSPSPQYAPIGSGSFSPPASVLGSVATGITITSLEISTDGNTWIPIISPDKPLRVALSGSMGNLMNLNVDPVRVPAGEYSAVRIKFQPDPEQQYEESGIVYDYTPLPYIFTTTNGSMWTARNEGQIDTLTVSSRNGFLVPFTIERGKTMYLALGISNSGFNYLNTTLNVYMWSISVVVRATRLAA